MQMSSRFSWLNITLHCSLCYHQHPPYLPVDLLALHVLNPAPEGYHQVWLAEAHLTHTHTHTHIHTHIHTHTHTHAHTHTPQRIYPVSYIKLTMIDYVWFKNNVKNYSYVGKEKNLKLFRKF
jgi:hypothetical protein